MIEISHTTLTEWATIFIAMASVISAVGAAVAAILSAKNGHKLTEVHDATNGMKDALVKATGDKRYEEGRKYGEANPLVRQRRSKPKAKKGRA